MRREATSDEDPCTSESGNITESIPTHQTTDNTPLRNSEETTLPNSENRDINDFRNFLRKECYTGTEWPHEFKFKGLLDKKTHQDMNTITKFCGCPKYKPSKDSTCRKVYFCQILYLVQKELDTQHELPKETLVKVLVGEKFSTKAYLKPSTELRVASGFCGINIPAQNGN